MSTTKRRERRNLREYKKAHGYRYLIKLGVAPPGPLEDAVLPGNILSWGQAGQSIHVQFTRHQATLKATAYNSHHFVLMKPFSDPSGPLDGDIITLVCFIKG